MNKAISVTMGLAAMMGMSGKKGYEPNLGKDFEREPKALFTDEEKAKLATLYGKGKKLYVANLKLKYAVEEKPAAVIIDADTQEVIGTVESIEITKTVEDSKDIPMVEMKEVDEQGL